MLIYMVTHNCGYIKFGSTYKILETSFVVFNFVDTQNMWVFISVDDQILLALNIGGN